jgi:DNA-binding transcriptional regulator LsrR (DeoR family)
MSRPKGKFKTREDFSDREWAELYREAMILKHQKKWGLEKISKKLGISKNTIRMWVYHYSTPNEASRYGIVDYLMTNHLGGWVSREEFERTHPTEG